MKYFASVLITLCLCGAAFFGYISYDKYKQDKAADLIAVQKKADEIERKKEAVSVLQASHLDSFKADLKKAAEDYKDYKDILADIVKPQNFATVEYAKENYNLFNDDIAPTFRKKANKMLSVFTDYNNTLNAAVQGDAMEIEKRFKEEWQEMHDVQLNRTVDLLSKDEELIQAYGALIEFYYVHSKLYDVDVDAEEFIFKREQDEKKHDILLKAIRDIRRDKATMRRKKSD